MGRLAGRGRAAPHSFRDIPTERLPHESGHGHDGRLLGSTLPVPGYRLSGVHAPAARCRRLSAGDTEGTSPTTRAAASPTRDLAPPEGRVRCPGSPMVARTARRGVRGVCVSTWDADGDACGS